MKIRIKIGLFDKIELNVDQNLTVNELRTKILERIRHTNHNLIILHGTTALIGDKKLSDYNIKEGNQINISSVYDGGGFIDNLKEESKKEIAERIGFDMNLIKRDELNINLIHFDLNMTNGENYRYFNNFKVDVVGGFHAMDDVNIFKKFCQKISEKKIPFVVVSSGTSGKDIIPICKNYNFIKEVIIFCMNYEYNKHYIVDYPGYVNMVVTSIDELYQYLKKFYGLGLCHECKQCPYQFQDFEIRMDKQIQQCPVITAEEYDKCYFLVHRAYAHFFGNFESIYHSFNTENYNIIIDLLNKLQSRKYFEDINEINDLKKIFNELKNKEKSDNFVESSIKAYTNESTFCYLFNRMMRNFESGIISLAYYMGPLLFELHKYVRRHKDFAFLKSMTLYRTFKCSETDFYLYKLNLNHIICFPALTSTSSSKINFTPTGLASSVNKTDNDAFEINLIIKYNHESDNISPGIIIEDKKGQNGYISENKHEKEVILFPFTFAKIVNIKSMKKFGKEIKIINLELVNRKSYIEFILRDNVEKRPLLSEKKL